MTLILDLHSALTSLTPFPPTHDAHLDTVMVIATPRVPAPRPVEDAPAGIAAGDRSDDLTNATWEDAEWQ